MAIEKELLDRLFTGRNPNGMLSSDGLLADLKKALSERILNTELDGNVEDDACDPARPGRNLRSQAEEE